MDQSHYFYETIEHEKNRKRARKEYLKETILKAKWQLVSAINTIRQARRELSED